MLLSSSVRAECRCTTSRRPLPALTNSSRAGTSSGSTNVPSTPPSRTIIPGFASRTTYGVTAPVSSNLGVMLISPSGRSGSEVIEYARQWCLPSTWKPTRRYWPGRCPSHSQPGFMTTVTASAVSRSIRSTRPRSSWVDHSGLISSR